MIFRTKRFFFGIYLSLALTFISTYSFAMRSKRNGFEQTFANVEVAAATFRCEGYSYHHCEWKALFLAEGLAQKDCRDEKSEYRLVSYKCDYYNPHRYGWRDRFTCTVKYTCN